MLHYYGSICKIQRTPKQCRFVNIYLSSNDTCSWPDKTAGNLNIILKYHRRQSGIQHIQNIHILLLALHTPGMEIRVLTASMYFMQYI